MRRNKFIRALIIVDIFVLMLVVPITFGYRHVLKTDEVSASVDQNSQQTLSLADIEAPLVEPVPVGRLDQNGAIVFSRITLEPQAQKINLKPTSVTKKTIKSYPSNIPDLLTFAQATKVLKKVALCESENNPIAQSYKSSAKGLLQILDGTWTDYECTGDVYNPADNMACGIKIATESGLHNWNESRHCWSKLVTAADLKS